MGKFVHYLIKLHSCSATAKQLTRHASRILVGGQDGTLQLISPANGVLLVTGYPVMRDIEMKMAVCDISNGNKKQTPHSDDFLRKDMEFVIKW